MDRRNSIKAIMIGAVSGGVLVEACKTEDKKNAQPGTASVDANALNRMPEEEEQYKELIAKKYFTGEEMATIAIFADIIIPKDDVSGSAGDAKVPDFIEFIVKDKPEHQIPMRGGLRWVDMQCLNRFGKGFKDCTKEQQIELVDEIAFPKKAKPEMRQGVSFFNLMRGLTATGFYTTEIGVKDIGYMGNRPNQWNGVPDEVLKQYNLAYTEKELKECVSFS
ncbi:MAG: gluconate 2-dehydrogenase subunit 3 family protein [Chitinophagaceae bacterium]|nr:gluconate 2-dehydrogenase subunit 3 family protein [Chitinophagaceae bacterium]